MDRETEELIAGLSNKKMFDLLNFLQALQDSEESADEYARYMHPEYEEWKSKNMSLYAL